MNDDLGPAADAQDPVLRAGQAIGSLMELWGFKRVHGVMWTVLYLADAPLDAQQIRERMGISSGLVSMTLHELIRWGVVTRVTLPGNRREHYRAEPDIWRAVAKVLRERELFCLQLALEDLRDARGVLAAGGPEGRALDRLDELVSLGEVGAGLLDRFLELGTLDISRLRQIQLGMGFSRILRKKGRPQASDR
ncbi:MAG: MarR family transcriptional regulator [Candidatus Sericytochromatia bacterium]|nr:MarR family transcriptional regulator [Candidatus Sericytochromatia bacterium]